MLYPLCRSSERSSVCVNPSVHLQVTVDYVFQDLAEISSNVPKVRLSREILPCFLNKSAALATGFPVNIPCLCGNSEMFL